MSRLAIVFTHASRLLLHNIRLRLAQNQSGVRDCSLGELLDKSILHFMLVLYESKGMCQGA